MVWLSLVPASLDIQQLAAFLVATGAAGVLIWKVMVWAVDGHRAIKAVPYLCRRVYHLEQVVQKIMTEGEIPEWDLIELLQEPPVVLPKRVLKQLPPE